MQHSNLPPVIGHVNVDGLPVNVRRRSGTMGDAAAALARSLPQNVTAFQGGNHAILANVGEDTGRRPSSVGAGQPGVLRNDSRGEGAGQ